MANSYDLSGRRAVITGGAGGIGLAIGRLFAASGATVELWDRSAEALAAAARGLPLAETRLVDVTSESSIEAALEPRRRIDVLVNGAGILGEVAPIWESAPEVFRRVLEVNLVGAYLATRAIVRRMREQEARPHRGHVINIASIQGKEGMALAGAYSASKAGLIALTKSVAKETALDAIQVLCMTPVAAETAMAREITPQRRADILGRIPMGRFVGVDEIARMAAFLASEDCSFSTGAIFDLSGGRATY
jgi:3-oxoacyl-[acyl-carrier protein] reductase